MTPDQTKYITERRERLEAELHALAVAENVAASPDMRETKPAVHVVLNRMAGMTTKGTTIHYMLSKTASVLEAVERNVAHDR
jgi:hypothetical protein